VTPAEFAKPIAFTFDPVGLVEFGSFDLAFKQDRGIAIEKTLHGQKVETPATRPAFVVGCVMLLETSAKIGGEAGVNLPILASDQKINPKAGESRPGHGSSVDRGFLGVRSFRIAFQSWPVVSGM